MSERVSFVNSDPDLIRFFLRFLDVAGVSHDRLIMRLQIHESGDVKACARTQATWAKPRWTNERAWLAQVPGH